MVPFRCRRPGQRGGGCSGKGSPPVHCTRQYRCNDLRVCKAHVTAAPYGPPPKPVHRELFSHTPPFLITASQGRSSLSCCASRSAGPGRRPGGTARAWLHPRPAQHAARPRQLSAPALFLPLLLLEEGSSLRIVSVPGPSCCLGIAAVVPRQALQLQTSGTSFSSCRTLGWCLTCKCTPACRWQPWAV